MKNIPEKKTKEYSMYLDEIIEELKTIKNSLKRGASRKENRKEVAHLQHAISSLKHLRGKNDRATEKMLLNSTDSLHESKNFGYDSIKKFLMGVSDYDIED